MLIPFTQPLDLESTLESGQAFRWRREDPSVVPAEGGLCVTGAFRRKPESRTRLNTGAQLADTGVSPSPQPSPVKGEGVTQRSPKAGTHTSTPWFWGVVFGNLVRLRKTAEGVEFSCAPDGEASLAPLLKDYLRLQDDLSAIYGSIHRDERVGAGIDRYPGMRLLRQDPWECLVSFICSANNNIQRISANVEAMCESFGRPLVLGGRVRNTFPSAEALSEAGEQALRDLRLGFRAKYVAAAAETVAAGRIDLYALREASYEEALAELTELPGVGDKVANCVMLFSLDKLEAFPVDVWIRRALRQWYLSEIPGAAKLAEREMRPWAQEYFGPYAGYANQYLFHKSRLEGRAVRVQT